MQLFSLTEDDLDASKPFARGRWRVERATAEEGFADPLPGRSDRRSAAEDLPNYLASHLPAHLLLPEGVTAVYP